MHYLTYKCHSFFLYPFSPSARVQRESVSAILVSWIAFTNLAPDAFDSFFICTWTSRSRVGIIVPPETEAALKPEERKSKEKASKHTPISIQHPASLSMSNSCQFTETITGYHQRILLCLNRLKEHRREQGCDVLSGLGVLGSSLRWNVNDIDAVPLLCLLFGQTVNVTLRIRRIDPPTKWWASVSLDGWCFHYVCVCFSVAVCVSLSSVLCFCLCICIDSSLPLSLHHLSFIIGIIIGIGIGIGIVMNACPKPCNGSLWQVLSIRRS